ARRTASATPVGCIADAPRLTLTTPSTVIPAKAGTQGLQHQRLPPLASRSPLRSGGNDDQWMHHPPPLIPEARSAIRDLRLTLSMPMSRSRLFPRIALRASGVRPG